MKWGLVPFWTKRNPDYSSVMKTINCRDDSLAQNGGMWNTMKARKRCLVIAQGFYEWLKVGPKEKVPHFVKRKDGKLMCLAGLWDCVRYEEGEREGERNYTYTIITTDSNAQLKFLHDRMPVILDPGSEKMRIWLDPERYEWSKELQGVLKPYDGELEVYPVSKEVGKVGNDSPSFIIPVASRENKGNIANFFANQGMPKAKASSKGRIEPEVEVVKEEGGTKEVKTESLDEVAKDADDGGMTREEEQSATAGSKRRAESPAAEEEPPAKKTTVKSPSPVKQPQRKTKSATTNVGKSPAKARSAAKGKEAGAQKITKFFGNSA
jgi:putative SOS response-associated peptidase YedK